MDPDFVLGASVFAVAGLYARLNGRTATLITLFGGWMFLPNCEYPAAVLSIGKGISAPTHAVALPSSPWFTKATALGLGCLLGMLLFHRTALLRYRPRWIDVPLAVWIMAPLPSFLANGLPITESLATSLSLLVGWGVPYILGAIYFADRAGMLLFVRTWVIAGVVMLPFAMAEFAADTFWYEFVYGGHPYRFDGSDRFLGYRPLVFFEHGNQFGMWAATAAIAAVGLCLIGDREKWRMPVAIVLMATCVMWQSHGAIGIMIGSLALLWALKLPRRVRRVLVAFTLFASLVAVCIALFAIATRPAWLHDQIRSLFHGLGKSSFTWRFARIFENLPQVIQHPLLGWARPDWSHKSSDGTFVDPIAISLWFHAAGRFGALGLGAVGCLLLISVLRVLAMGFWSRTANCANVTTLLAVVLAANVADLALNSGFILPLLLATGGLSAAGRGEFHSED